MIAPLVRRPFENFENLFETWFDDKLHRNWQPEVDIKETTKEYTLMLDLPGIREEDVSVEASDNTLTISGKRDFSQEERKEDYVCIERGHGSFRRAFTLSATIQTEKVNAKFKDGVLTIHVPKLATSKPKTIPIRRT